MCIKIGLVIHQYGEEYTLTKIDGDLFCFETDRLNDDVPYWEWWTREDVEEYLRGLA